MVDSPQSDISPENYILELYRQNLAFYSDKRGKGAIRNLQQTFPHPWIYIAELIQNAIDEGAKKLLFHTNDGTLVFEHDGESFNQEDVEGLCTRGVSTKSAKTIGFMGVGFKSVFMSFQRVDVSSGQWKFSLKVPVKIGPLEDNQRVWLGCVLPEYSPDLSDPSEGMTCRFALSERLDGLDAIENDLREVLQKDLTLLPLLAIHGIEELVWGDKKYLLIRSKQEDLIHHCTKTVIESKHINEDHLSIHISRWLLFSKTYKPSEKAKKRFLEHREIIPETEEDKASLYLDVSKTRTVQVFCRLDDLGNPILPERGRAFSVLPTNVYFPMKINIQADWLLDISRSGLMDVRNNPWHEEILEQLPVLLRSFLEWLVSSDGPNEEGWYNGFNIIPRFDHYDQALQWSYNESLTERFKAELACSAFLPIRGQDEIYFQSPAECSYLPESLNIGFDDDDLYPWDLFGKGIISNAILGEESFASLKSLNLLRELTPQELTEYWGNDAVVKWLSHWSDIETKKSKLIFLFAALHSLEADPNWSGASLKCIPTESFQWENGTGTWRSREDLQRLPSSWQMFNKEPQISDSLKKSSGDDEYLLDTSVYFYTHRFVGDPGESRYLSQAKRFLDKIKEIPLNHLVDKWWNDQSVDKLTHDNVEIILNFTRWIREKQPGQRSLITRILATDSSQGLILLPLDQCLLCAPYAGDYRRSIFPKLPVVIPKYLSEDPSDATPTDWRFFFESGSPCVKGKPDIDLTIDSYRADSEDVVRWLGRKPNLRATDINLSWQGFEIDNKACYLLDGSLPFLDEIDGNFSKADSFGKWLQEDPSVLLRKSKKVLAYIPIGTGRVTAIELQDTMTWVQQIRETVFIPANDRNCYRPCDVLAGFDSVRPKIPYSVLSEELIGTLEDIGIIFGENIPEVHSIIRLQMEGPTADSHRLMELVDKAIDDVRQDALQIAKLREALINHPLIPVPNDHITPDRLSRIPFSRIVFHAGPGKARRSDLMGWVVAKTKYEYDPDLTALINRIEMFSEKKIPLTTNIAQTLNFIQWVWETEPEADRVRSYLRSAYDYCIKDPDFSRDTDQVSTFMSGAKVFTSTKRWVQAKIAYYDDIQKAVIRSILRDVELATLGHLGSDSTTIKEVAKLLQLRPLSERIRIECRYGTKVSTPEHWNENIAKLFRVVQTYLSTFLSVDDDIGNTDNFLNIRFIKVSEIIRVVFDNGRKVYERKTNANFEPDTGKLFVKGDIEDIAPDLCELIVDILQLSQRGELVARIAPALFAIGITEQFDKILSKLREFCGVADMPADVEPKVEDAELSLAMDEGHAVPSQEQDPLKGSSSMPANILEGKKTTRHYEYGAQNTAKDETTEEDPDNLSEQPERQETEDEAQDGQDYDISDHKSHVREKKRRISHIVTYVAHGHAEEQQNVDTGGDYDEHIRIGEEGERCVIEVEESEGRKAHKMPRNHPGYDIESYGRDEHDVRFIEVKAIDGPWTDSGVGITSRQFKEAQKRGDDFWLYVVEDVTSDEPIIHRFQNPVDLIDSYRFDSNWRELAISEAGTNRLEDLVPGQAVKVDGEDAEIIEIVKYGNADAVKVQLKNSELIKQIVDRRRIEFIR